MVKPEAMSLMMELAIQADKRRGTLNDESNYEAEKEAAIVLCKRRIEATINLYGNGAIE